INDARSEYLALFSLQTTYAIIIKLIACKLLNKRLTNSENIKYFNDLTVVTSDELKEFLEKIEDGYSFSDNGIYNLLEGDFFSWYHLDSHWDYELYTLFNNLISKIEEYTTFTFLHEHTSIDVFKELYIEIMPKSIRHSLGEYFTPAWLADNVVQESINRIDSKNWKAIDPTCGSGIFITTLINKVFDQYDLSEMNSKEKENLLKEIYNRVKGIDINPLNVLTSGVSYMLAISPLIDEETTFEIPVYLGDSAIIPTTEKIENTECYVNTIETIEGNLNAIFPVDFVESSEFTPTLITAQKLLNIGILDEVISYLLEKISKYTAINVTLENKIQDLCNKIAELSSKQWDGIWLRITSNFLKAGSLKDLNIVVGNPPWVKWEYLPQNYAEKIKSVSLERHLFSGQTYMGAISLNICALIAHVNASYRLNEDGILAFLMPKTMMTQDSYEGFRNFILDIETNKRFYLQYAEDWEKSGHPFITMKDAFLSYYFKKDYIDYTKGVPLTNVIKKEE
ncbi:Eco57I restriction-modification methylase domain-containing protein, partial [Staphylococcus chromogenes]